MCELLNTLSSGAILLVGLLGMALHRRLEARFFWAFLAISVVGAGSIAFHATLRFEFQMMDEIPMLYTALVMLYIVLENQRERRFGRLLPVALAAHGVLVTALAALTRATLQFYLFQLSFASMEFFALYRVYAIYRASDSPLIWRLFWVGTLSYGFGILVWFTDLKACRVMSVVLPGYGIPNPELHAWWHVLVSIGLYSLTLLLACRRIQVLGATPELRWAWRFIPYATSSTR